MVFPSIRPLPCRRLAAALALSIIAALAGPLRAQDFPLLVADPDPLGLGAFVPGLDLDLPEGLTSGIKGEFLLGVKAQSVYQSNFFLSEDHEDDEWAFTLAPTLRYLSDPEGGAANSLTASYRPVGRRYAENDHLDGIDHAGDLALDFRGTSNHLALFTRYQELSATDRLTGEFVSGSLLTSGLRLTHQLAPFTSVNTGLSVGMSDYEGSGNEGAEVYTAYLGALWKATERSSLGSMLRATATESDTIGTRKAWAVLAQARHQSGESIWLSASLGPEFASTSDGGEDSMRLSGELTARVVLDERWTWSTSLRSASVPSPSENRYLVNDLGLTTRLRRQLLHGWLGGGVEYHFSDYQDLGGATAGRGDEHHVALFLGYGRPILSDRAVLDCTVRHGFNQGQVDWDQWQVTAGLTVTF